jgi:Rod binding domain-containing protein
LDPVKLNYNAILPDRGDIKAVKDKAALLDDSKKLKVSHDFESVLITRLVDEMKTTIPDSELTDDETSGQIQSLFYSNLADEIGKKGGMGLWKTIYGQMNAASEKPSMDTSL